MEESEEHSTLSSLNSGEHKSIMDSIHGMIPVDQRLFQIIDTPHFQRLRHIKQLGTSYYCYPTATHTRFSHSIGAAHLAGQVFDLINDPSLDLRPKDRLILCTAGLVHDLGHGPFSHSFEHTIIPTLGGEPHWSHEAMGLRILDHLLEQEHVDIFDSYDLVRLKQILTGVIPHEYRFLSQIISNQDFGLDVDRVDYLLRDSYSVGINPSFNWSVLSSHLKAQSWSPEELPFSIEQQDQNDACPSVVSLSLHRKRQSEIYNFYQTRYNLFHQIYNHPITKAVEFMIADAILESENFLKIRHAIDDVEKFLQLDDSIYNWILREGNDRAKSLLKNIQHRHFYRLIYQSTSPPEPKYLPIGLKSPNGDNPRYRVDKVTDHFGHGEQNPLGLVPFYSTQNITKQLSSILHERFASTEYRVYDLKLEP